MTLAPANQLTAALLGPGAADPVALEIEPGSPAGDAHMNSVLLMVEHALACARHTAADLGHPNRVAIRAALDQAAKIIGELDARERPEQPRPIR